MTVLHNLNVKSKGNGAAPLSSRHPWPARLPHPKKRKSLFAHQIWSVERKPRFACSAIYGFSG